MGADSGLQGQQWTTDQQYLHGPTHQEGAATVLPDHQETNGPQEDQGDLTRHCFRDQKNSWNVAANLGTLATARLP